MTGSRQWEEAGPRAVHRSLGERPRQLYTLGQSTMFGGHEEGKWGQAGAEKQRMSVVTLALSDRTIILV